MLVRKEDHSCCPKHYVSFQHLWAPSSVTLCNEAWLKISQQPEIQNEYVYSAPECVFTSSQSDVQTGKHADRQACWQSDIQYRQTDFYRQSEHMYKSGIMLIFYFSQRGLLAWQKGNKNYSIKQLSFHIQI